MEMTVAAELEYAQLLGTRRPHVISTKRVYDATMREVEALTIRGENRSAAETEYYRVLCALVSDYERHVGDDACRNLTPAEAVQELMELKSISQSRVADALGDRAAASSILSGRRQVSKAQAKKLANLFRVDAGIFV